MIVCSCNVFTEAQVQRVVANTTTRPRMSKIYASLACSAQCGRCAHTIKTIIERNGLPVAACASQTSPQH